MSVTNRTTTGQSEDVWDRLESERDLFETIVEEDGPFAPDAENLLAVLDERQEDDDA